MLTFCGYKSQQDGAKPLSMSDRQHNKMVLLAHSRCRPIAPMLQHLSRHCSASGFCNNVWKPLISDLARMSPVANGLLREPHLLLPILTRMVTIGVPESNIFIITMEEQNMLRKLCPTLFQALHFSGLMTNPAGEEWNALVPILKEFIHF